MEEKETIADLCERLRETDDKYDCEKLVEMWGLKCNDFKSCGECGRAFYGGLADRIEAAHQREVDELRADNGDTWLKGYAECHQELLDGNEVIADDLRKCGWSKSDLANLGKPCGDGDAVLGASTIRSTDRRREVVDRLRAYREHPPVRDLDGLIVEDTYSVGEVEGIVTGKETFTTGEYIDALISLIDTSNQPDSQSDAPESGENAESAASKDEMRDFDDTREKVEGSLAHLIVGICAARLRTDMTNMELVARFKDEFIRILDRQAAITERNCQAEYDDMCDYLQAVVDGQQGDMDVYRKKCVYLQGEVNRLQGEVEHLNKAPEAYRLANEALREQNMELRRTIDDLHERYANADAVNGLVEHANDRLKVEADRQRDALERCRLAYETVRGLFDGWDGE